MDYLVTSDNLWSRDSEKKIKTLLDTGASISIIRQKDLLELGFGCKDLKAADLRVVQADGPEMKISGMICLPVMIEEMVKSSPCEWFRGVREHAIPAHCGFVVILWGNLYCLCFRGRSKEGSVWIEWHLAWWQLCLHCISIFYMFCNLLWITDKGKKGRSVTLCGWYVRPTISLSVLVRNLKGLNSRSPTGLEMEKERKFWEKTEGQLTKEPREGSRQRSPGDRRSAEGGNDGRQSKMSWHSS